MSGRSDADGAVVAEPGSELPPTATGPRDEGALAAGRDHDSERPGREPGDMIVALSPRQILGGFALIAGLILMLRRRGRGSRRD